MKKFLITRTFNNLAIERAIPAESLEDAVKQGEALDEEQFLTARRGALVIDYGDSEVTAVFTTT